MAKRESWTGFIESDFFQHIRYDVETGWTPDAINEFLKLVDTELLGKGISLNSEDPELELPNTEIKHEAIGYNVERIKEQLRSVAENGGATEPWIQKYLDDANFSRYVAMLLDFLSQKARSGLPSLKKSVDPKLEREESTQRENSEDVKYFADKAKEAQEAAEEAKIKTVETQKSALAAKKAALNAQKAAESIVPNMLTTLGVFVAIIVAVVAAYLSLLLNQHINDPKPLNLAMCLLMGHILLNVVFLLLYLLSKMSHRSVACNCPVANVMDCSICNEHYRKNCHLRNKVWLRYPYVVLFNGIFVLTYFALFLWHVVKVYVAATIDEWVVLFLLGLLLVGGIIALFVAIKSLRWKGEDESAERKKAGLRQKIRTCVKKKKDERKEKRASTRKQMRKIEMSIEKLRKELQALNDKVQSVLEPEEEFDGET